MKSLTEWRSENKLMSSEMNAIKAKLCVCTTNGSNSTTLPPRGNSIESVESVNARNTSETAMPDHDVLINCNS
jgi:hypothetical protein